MPTRGSSARRRFAAARIAIACGRRCIAGTIDTIGSDHSPCPPEMKHLDRSQPNGGDWQHAWGGHQLASS